MDSSAGGRARALAVAAGLGAGVALLGLIAACGPSDGAAPARTTVLQPPDTAPVTVTTTVGPRTSTTGPTRPAEVVAAGGPLGLVVDGPRRYATGVPNPVSLVITNTGPARTVTVRLALGTPRTTTPGSAGQAVERAIVQRQDATGAWTDVPVTDSATSPIAETASYQLHIGSGTTGQNLRIVPIGAQTVPLDVRLLDGSTVLVDRNAGAPLVDPQVTVLGPQSVRSDDGSAEFAVTLTNTTAVAYPAIGLTGLAFVDGGPGSMQNLPVEWLDGSTWRPLGPAGDWNAFGPVGLPAYGTVTLHVRVQLNPMDVVGTGDIAVIETSPVAGGQDASGSTGLHPLSDVRADAMFDYSR